MSSRRSRSIALVLGICTAALFVITGFEREYVMRSGDLLNLHATPRHDGIVITGSLLASGAKIARLTRTCHGSVVLLRVYAAPIEEKDDPRVVRRSFAALIPRDPNLMEIMVGDDSRWLTFGRVHGIPIRVFRPHREDSVSEVVWHL